MTMGLGIYKKSLLLLTINTSEDVIIKSKARELFLHYKTLYKVCQNKQNSRKPLYSGHLQKTDTRLRPKLSVIWRFHCIFFSFVACSMHKNPRVTL